MNRAYSPEIRPDRVAPLPAEARLSASLWSTSAMFYSLITLPTASDTLSGVTTWSNALFSDSTNLVYLGVGLILGGMALAFFGRKIIAGVKQVIGRKGGKRRRR